MAGRKKRELPEGIDPKLREKFKREVKAAKGIVVEQGPIHSWADHDFGFELAGDFVSIREGRARPGSAMKPGFLFDIVNAETGEVETWGCPAILKARMDQANVQNGDSIKIVLAGQVESAPGRQPAWDFLFAHFPKS